jgi:hypothetical protein
MDEGTISRAEQLEQKRTYWKQHIDHWQQTDLTQVEYCRRHNLKHHQLVYWKKRFLKTELDVSFVPLKLDDLQVCDFFWKKQENRFKDLISIIG